MFGAHVFFDIFGHSTTFTQVWKGNLNEIALDAVEFHVHPGRKRPPT